MTTEAPSFQIESLAKIHNRSAFVSGVESLDRYLKLQAGQDSKRKVAATFVLVSKADPSSIIGYYTLSSTAIDPGELSTAVRKRMPPYPLIPATLIGRLARDVKHKAAGIGDILLIDALKRSFQHSKEIASFAVVVNALNSKAYAWYAERWGFIPLLEEANQLYLPMKTIEKLFEQKA